MTPIAQHLAPFVGSGRGADLRVALVDGEFEIAIAIVGHSDLRGGRVNAAELANFARRLMEAANRQALANWNDVIAHTVPGRNGDSAG